MHARLSNRSGFTLVELIIIIAVIGILAGITILGYGAWRAQTIESVVKSDLSGAASAMQDARNWSDTGYPSLLPGTIQPSENSELSLNSISNAQYFCIEGTSLSDSSVRFRVSSRNTSPSEGGCDPEVTTVAGSGARTYANGTGTSASFLSPRGLAFNTEGTLYAADSYLSMGHRVRTISPTGSVGLLAGTSTAGYVNSSGAAARFSLPTGVAVDSQGNILVVDSGNNRIRRITPTGSTTLFAGSGTAGYLDGAATSARFNSPHSIAIDKNDTVYVSESAGQRIRKITSNGIVSTLAGSGVAGFADGVGTAAQFANPYGIAVDSNGNVYVADPGNSRIRKITPNGTVSTLAGSGVAGFADGVGTAAQFSGLIGLAIDSNNTLYATDTSNYRIRSITQDGTVATVAGSGTSGFQNGSGSQVQFRTLWSIAVDAKGDLYVGDATHSVGSDDSVRIRKISFQ